MLKPSSILDSSCEFKFRGYHGTYDIEVLFPDGQVISNEIDLHPKRRPLLIEINTHGGYAGRLVSSFFTSSLDSNSRVKIVLSASAATEHLKFYKEFLVSKPRGDRFASEGFVKCPSGE